MNTTNIQKKIQNINLEGNNKVKTTVIYNKNFVSYNINEAPQIEKGAKGRRKRKHKKKDEIINGKKELKIIFKIEAVKHPTKYEFFRYRNDKYNYVNLYSFLNNVRKTIIFKNQLCDYKNANDSVLSNVKTAHQNGTLNNKKQHYINSDIKYPNSSRKRPQQRKRRKNTFEPYLTDKELANLNDNEQLVEGVIRINTKNFKDAYVSNIDENEKDYVIVSIRDRNRALEGDMVYLKLKPKEDWKENLITATVVSIKQKIHPRTAIGHLTLSADGKQTALLIPRDIRVPKMRIPTTEWPLNFKQNYKLYENVLFLAKIINWNDVKFAEGTLLEQLGTDDNLQVGNKALILEHQLNVSEIPTEALEDVNFDSTIPINEIKTREDLRKECVFTIDPATAKDLDDAMSLKKLPNGNFEIGVHIADVTYYLHDETYLDKLVSEKATSIYLVDKVYHMLPLELCLCCSLLPDKDSLAFSVFWEMTTNGEIVSHRFGRTVIRSCVQLAYEHAQMMIENPDRIFTNDELPPISNGYDSDNIKETVQILQEIAVKLRKNRFDNGALRIDQPKLFFDLEPIHKTPIDMAIYEIKDANKLIEEFMLLANITVAERILADFPNTAFLRNHRAPHKRVLKDIKSTLNKYEIDFDIESGADIQSSLWKYDANSVEGQARLTVLNQLVAKAMQRANYICSGATDYYQHFALSLSTYTHFTSPIRRYADIMVHRLLAAALGYRNKPNWNLDYIVKIANNCNKQKDIAKKASEASTELYLAYFIEKNQPFIKKAVVADVRDRSFEIIVLETGSCLRISTSSFGDNISYEVVEMDNICKILVTFAEEGDLPEVKQVIELFQLVTINITKKPKSYKLIAELVRPQ